MRRDKWKMHKIMKRSKNLIYSLPYTRLLGKHALWKLLDKYGAAMMKPRGGRFGYGVIQVTAKRFGWYEIHVGRWRKAIKGKKKVYACLRKIIRSRKYIIQRRIPLATINGRLFDIRVMAQRRKRSAWKITGKLVRVAAKGYIITNVLINVTHSRLPFKQALKRSSLQKKYPWRVLVFKIDRLALLAAKRISRFYPEQKMVGFDLGLDKKGKEWIIEANLRPDISMFHRLKNKSMYRTILSYQRNM